MTSFPSEDSQTFAHRGRETELATQGEIRSILIEKVKGHSDTLPCAPIKLMYN